VPASKRHLVGSQQAPGHDLGLRIIACGIEDKKTFSLIAIQFMDAARYDLKIGGGAKSKTIQEVTNGRRSALRILLCDLGDILPPLSTR
jgi:hypothetical protein